jgi:glycine oxidase
VKIVIIGAGIMGLSIARELALQSHEHEIIVLEKSIPGAEASSAAAGMLAPQLESTVSDALFELNLESRYLWDDFATQLKSESHIDLEYSVSGSHEQASVGQPSLQEKVAWMKSRSLGAALESDGSARYALDAQVNPRRLLQALLISAQKQPGIKIRKAVIDQITHTDAHTIGVEVEGTRVACDAVVLAAGAWSSQVKGSLLATNAVVPVRGQLIRFHSDATLMHAIEKRGHTYVFQRPGGDIIAGSTIEFVGFDKSTTADAIAELKRESQTLVPALAQLELCEQWAGLRPWTADQMPLIGSSRETPRLLYAAGHFRNGILLAPLTAKRIAAHVNSLSNQI